MKLIREGMEDYEYLVQAAKKDSAKAHQIASTLLPHPYDTHKSAADLEKARNELFDMLDTPAAGGSGGAGGAGTSGTGGVAAGGSGGIDGGATGGTAGKGSGAAQSGGCGCRAAGAPSRDDAGWFLVPLAWLVVRRRAR